MTTMKSHLHPSDVHGFGRLAIDATLGITDIVEDLHRQIAGIPLDGLFGGIPGLVYNSIRGVTRLAGGTLAGLALFISLPGEQDQTPQRQAWLAALNGLLGDHLVATRSPLAIPMRLRQGGLPLELENQALAASIPQPTGKLLVLVHGLCLNDLQWNRQGHDHGAALARDLGYTPLYLHYNSGLHVSTNGQAFAHLLEALVRAWPAPLEEIVIVAHSLGGLVTRSACYTAAISRLGWLSALRKLVFLGTPHHGTPLERGGNWFETILGTNAYSAPFTRLGKIRSASITDMRYGSLLDEDWEARDRFALSLDWPRPVPLPAGVQCYAIAAAIASKTSRLPEALQNDGLVPVSSALGHPSVSGRVLAFPPAHQWVGFNLKHFDLLSQPEVYAQIRRWLEEAP